MKKALLVLTLLLSLHTFAQDIHFSQFYAAPLNLNPAFTGVFNGNVRLTGNFRSQWQSVSVNAPYRTYAASVDFSGRSGPFNRIGGGISVFSDKAGTSQLSTTNFTGAFAYTFSLSRGLDYYLCVGGEVGLSQRSINYGMLTFGTQYLNNTYDATNATGEEGNITQNITVSDGSLGLLWYHLKTPRISQYAGISYWHVNRPNVAFIDNDDDRMFTKIILQGGAQMKMNRTHDLLLNGMIAKQGPSFEIEPGGLIKFIMSERKTATFGGTAFYIGPYARLSRTYSSVNLDALILATKFDLNNLTFGVSYDVNTSALTRGSSSRGGPEISVQYISRIAHQRSKYFCPRFN